MKKSILFFAMLATVNVACCAETTSKELETIWGNTVVLSDEVKQDLKSKNNPSSKLILNNVNGPVVALIRNQNGEFLGYLNHGTDVGAVSKFLGLQESEGKIENRSGWYYLSVKPSLPSQAAQFLLYPRNNQKKNPEREEFFIESYLKMDKEDEKRRALHHEGAGKPEKERDVYFANTNRMGGESWKITSEGFVQHNTSKWYLALDFNNRLIANPDKKNAVKIEFRQYSDEQEEDFKLEPQYTNIKEFLKDQGSDCIVHVSDKNGRDLGYGKGLSELLCGESLRNAEVFTIDSKTYHLTSKVPSYSGFTRGIYIYDKHPYVFDFKLMLSASGYDQGLVFEYLTYADARKREFEIRKKIAQLMKKKNRK